MNILRITIADVIPDTDQVSVMARIDCPVHPWFRGNDLCGPRYVHLLDRVLRGIPDRYAVRLDFPTP